MPVGVDPGDPRGWGIAPVTETDGYGHARRLTFDDVVGWTLRHQGPTMAEMDRVISRYSDDLEAAQHLYEQGCMPPEDVRVFMEFEAEAERLSDTQRRRLHETTPPAPTRAEGQRMIAEAYGLPDEVLGIRPEHDELIRSTRAEFPHDPLDYGRRCPVGPMHWTPPAEGEEEVPPWRV